ncbi:hypothetical protein Pint_11381 [Pistacia integerrima]|uniref:Uncharacterized protein n=1 Tax=Pistacia integerrima TaxID=434235 RepID=A0ACC0XF52_9ROSI|nr:hypothetical protein Pint_11381 [Pistacia integerrima]
MVPAPNRRLYS